MGNTCEVFIDIDDECCTIGIRVPNKNITYDVAKYLGVDIDLDAISQNTRDIFSNEKDLFLIIGIDCVSLIYKHPGKYKELLAKIEEVVNTHFKLSNKNTKISMRIANKNSSSGGR